LHQSDGTVNVGALRRGLSMSGSLVFTLEGKRSLVIARFGGGGGLAAGSIVGTGMGTVR